MYSESDIDGAVTAGVLSPQMAAAFRNYIANSRSTPAVDEEHFPLLTGFNDIFVSIALCLALFAIGQIGWLAFQPLGGIVVAAASWLLAEYFTRKRRMALPSILLLAAFAGSFIAITAGILAAWGVDLSPATRNLVAAGTALVVAGAAWAHWQRFMVPITVAAGAAALGGMVVALANLAFPTNWTIDYIIIGAVGLCVFALAMWWDMSDRERRTRRSDVAFWLHLAAAPLIAHPLFNLLGVFNNNVSIATAVIVLLLYLAFAFVALAVDRRALLVSGLIYVGYALYSLVEKSGLVELTAAVACFIIGSALLMLSVYWHQMRSIVVGYLGEVQHRLPPVQTTVPA